MGVVGRPVEATAGEPVEANRLWGCVRQAAAWRPGDLFHASGTIMLPAYATLLQMPHTFVSAAIAHPSHVSQHACLDPPPPLYCLPERGFITVVLALLQLKQFKMGAGGQTHLLTRACVGDACLAGALTAAGVGPLHLSCCCTPCMSICCPS